MAPIRFSVSYNLREYLSFVRELYPNELPGAFESRGRKLGPIEAAIVRALTPVAASVAFFFKKRRMPVCDFVIDEEGIARQTADGKYMLPWSGVVAVYRFSQGYLVRSSKGAMPLPYRCLDAGQRASLDALVDKRLAELAPVPEPEA
jgi:hypothetical protein